MFLPGQLVLTIVPANVEKKKRMRRVSVGVNHPAD
jgi:hypothetical protein